MPQALGKILILAALAFVAVWSNRRLKADEPAPSNVTDEHVLQVIDARRVRLRRHARLTGWAAIALLLIGVGVLWIAPSRTATSTVTVGPSDETSDQKKVGDDNETIDLHSTGTVTLSNLLPISLALMAIGGVLLVKRQTRMAGTALLTTGAISLAGSLFGPIEVESLLKLDKGAIQLEFSRVTGSGGFGIQHITEFEGFASGSDELRSLFELEGASTASQAREVEARRMKVEQSFEDIETLWRMNKTPNKAVLLILVGSTDRVPLRAQTRQRFEANVGLGQARANAVKQELLRRNSEAAGKAPHMSNNDILVLVSGPGITPNQWLNQIVPSTDDPLAKDRKVTVWAMWGSEAASK